MHGAIFGEPIHACMDARVRGKDHPILEQKFVCFCLLICLKPLQMYTLKLNVLKFEQREEITDRPIYCEKGPLTHASE